MTTCLLNIGMEYEWFDGDYRDRPHCFLLTRKGCGAGGVGIMMQNAEDNVSLTPFVRAPFVRAPFVRDGEVPFIR
jgi:hypothetical protein